MHLCLKASVQNLSAPNVFLVQETSLTVRSVRSFWRAKELRWVERTSGRWERLISAWTRWKRLRRTYLDDIWWHVRRDGARWAELRWGEMRWEELTLGCWVSWEKKATLFFFAGPWARKAALFCAPATTMSWPGVNLSWSQEPGMASGGSDKLNLWLLDCTSDKHALKPQWCLQRCRAQIIFTPQIEQSHLLPSIDQLSAADLLWPI